MTIMGILIEPGTVEMPARNGISTEEAEDKLRGGGDGQILWANTARQTGATNSLCWVGNVPTEHGAQHN